MGRGHAVSLLAFYSDVPSSNTVHVWASFIALEKNESKRQIGRERLLKNEPYKTCVLTM